jgi:hypothetical protein
MPEKFSELKPERAIGRDEWAYGACPMETLGLEVTLGHVPSRILLICGSANRITGGMT